MVNAGWSKEGWRRACRRCDRLSRAHRRSVGADLSPPPGRGRGSSFRRHCPYYDYYRLVVSRRLACCELAQACIISVLFPFDVQPRRRKIISDLVSGLIYLAAVFGILKYAFHQPIEGLLATSGLVALVLGLALQSTLADLFSGIALNIEDPFRAGDWISVNGVNEGQVIEINWRATRLRDRNGDTMVIPNSQIAKSRVTNHSLPERVHPSSINVDIEAESSADRAEKALISAVLNAKHVLSDPPPEVTVQAIRGRSASYCVSFYVADFADIPSVQSDALAQVLSYASDSKLRLAQPQTEVRIIQNLDSATRPHQPLVPNK